MTVDSNRKALDGLESRYSLHEGLPASYQLDRFTDQYVRAFDDVNAPLHASVDDLDAYFDPQLAPSDFLTWLGTWLGADLNRRWPVKRRREFVAKAVKAYRLRGTAEGIAMAVELYTGLRPTVTDNGGVSASRQPMEELPGSDQAFLQITVETGGRSDVDEELIARIVHDAKPAHMSFAIQMI